MNTDRYDASVAVTGMACRFPGAPNVRTFWDNLCAGRSGIRVFDAKELRSSGVAEELIQNPSFIPACAPIPQPHAFDAAHFGIAPAAARMLDLQQRVFLECAWSALEGSGTLAAARSSVSVFAGCSDTTYGMVPHGHADDQGAMLAAALGSSSDFLAARVAFLLNLRGPAITVRAACATSLVAIHFAVQSLLTNECDVAVAGGVAIRHPLQRGHVHEPGGIYSSDALCRPYDRKGSGIVSGDGAGAVVLRRLQDAVADGDYIHAVICGSAVTNDGATKASFTAPSVDGQVEAVLNALEVAEVDPQSIGFVEGHGTATPMGDPIEVEALKRAWGKKLKRSGHCILGSVKSNIGHLDAAAGVAGFIKACLAVEHGKIPATLNYSEPNPHAGLSDSCFAVSAETAEWPTRGLRLAGVHSLGLGGTNAHVVIKQAPTLQRSSSVGVPDLPVVLTLSTRHAESMDAYAMALAAELRLGACDVARAAHTLQFGRSLEPYRRAVVGRDADALAAGLVSLTPPIRSRSVQPRLLMVFPGDGKRRSGALTQLAEHLPRVAATMSRAGAHLRSRWNIDLTAALLGAESSPYGIIPAIVAQGAALHAALEEFGVGGDLLIGQSLGEITAAVGSGILELEDALDLAVAREKAFRAVVPSGALAINMAAELVRKRLPGHLELSLINSPQRCVVSGAVGALELFAAELEAEEAPVQRLDLISAVHSSFLDPVLKDFRQAAARLRPHTPKRTLLSSLGPTLVTEEVAAQPEHWVRQLRETVHFDACMRAAASDQRDTVVVDVSMGGGSAAAILETIGEKVRGVVRMSPQTEGMTELEAFGLALARLWEHGIAIDWDAWPGRCAERISLPVAPLVATVHQPVAMTAAAVGPEGTRDSVQLWVRNWRRIHPMRAAMDAPQKILLFAGSDSVSQGLASRLTALGHSVEVATEDTWPEPGMQIDQVVYARALSATDGPASIAAFLEAAARASRRLDKSSTLFVLTRFAFDIVGTEVLSANSAALSVAALVFAQEHPELNLCCCDLASDEADAEMVVRVMLSRLKNTVWLGVRGRTVWRPNVEPISQPLVEPQTHVATQEACILVGGSGRFGRWVGQWLAQSGCRDLTLVGRSGAMSKPLSVAIAAMREAGARVAVVQADVTDRNAMFRILQDVRASSGKNMTIFHLAGEPHAASAHAPVADLLGGDLRAALEEQWGAKVKGAEILLDWMRLHSGVRCVMFSSNASVLGGPGLAAYAAANAAMDAMALSAREREGLDCSSLSWDGWRLADDEQRSERSALEGFALHGKEPWDALLKAMSSGYGHLAVAKGNLAERHHKWVEELPGMGEEPTSAASLTNGAGSQKDDLVIVVRRVWSEVLGIEADDHADLFQVGGDSLTAMRIRTWIERIFGARLTLREVLQNRTIAGLAALVRRQLDAELGITKADEKATDFQNDDRTIRGRL